MNDVAKRLKVVLDANGSALIEDTDSLRRLLLRGQPDGPPEVQMLVLMVERGAVQHLFKWAKTPAAQRPPYAQMRDHIAQKFATAGVLPASEVRWALDIWVDALPALAQHARQAPPPAPAPATTDALTPLPTGVPSALAPLTKAPTGAPPLHSAGAGSPESARATSGTGERWSVAPMTSPSASPATPARPDSASTAARRTSLSNARKPAAGAQGARAAAPEPPVYRNRLMAPIGTPDDEFEAADATVAAVPPPPTGARLVSPVRGLSWLVEAWRLFAAHPFLWWACIIVFVVVSVLPALLPIVGPAIAMLLSPILLAGLLLGAHAVHEGEPLKVGHVFAGFRHNPLGLMLTVILQLGLIGVIVAAIVFSVGGSIVMSAMLAAKTQQPAEVLPVLLAMGPALLLLILLFAVTLSMYFAAPLVAIRNENPVRAVWLSMTGTLKNALAGLVNTLALLVLAVPASIPLGLGWLVLAPVMLLTTYAAFRDIYLSD